MKLLVFGVRDTAANMFGTPMFLPSVGQAMRSFSDEVNRDEKDNVLFRHPMDFEMWSLGEFDTDTGKFDGEPRQLARGVDLKLRPDSVV